MANSVLLDTNIVIAAIAYQYDLPLVTRDAHFREIDCIVVETW